MNRMVYNGAGISILSEDVEDNDLEKEVEERDVNHDDGLEQLRGPYSPKGGYPGDGLWG